MANVVTYDREPDAYRHWSLVIDGSIATLSLNVDQDGGLRPGYKLKLNSYDLGVDIELHDALQRVRFEHPQVRVVVITSGLERTFCAGANIYMLAQSEHAWKVNFCKFTNETRNSMEDSSRYSGIRFIAACNGTAAGGGYELALACDEIFLIDDRSSTVSLPEVPLLGVLPGTGGLTRLTDKRRVRRDIADVFCTSAEGVRGQRAQDWRLVDHLAAKQTFDEAVRQRAVELARGSDRPADGKGVAMTPLAREITDDGYRYGRVTVSIEPEQRLAVLTVRGPAGPIAETPEAIVDAGTDWWPLRMARELEDAILMLRTNHDSAGLWLLRTEGDLGAMLDADRALSRNADHWFVREVIGQIRRTYARLDVTARSLFALVELGSCFAGTLFELILAADRSYMLANTEEEGGVPAVALSDMNFGPFVTTGGTTRLCAHFSGDTKRAEALRSLAGHFLGPQAAHQHGLVTFIPDELDWDDEIRLAIEERASLSPDALTGMEANLRFGGPETMLTKVFGRLSAWQNWIFMRPNAVGEKGALRVFGSGSKADFDWKRV